MRTSYPTLLGIAMLSCIPAVAYAGGADILSSQCSACHALTKPAVTSIDSLWERKAPDLYYAGVKFNRDWLVNWLQDPKPIRPAGYPYFKTIVPGKDHDEIDKSKPQAHVRLSKDDAVAVADALMSLKPEGIVEKGLYKGGAPNMRMGALAFNKLRGCAACHKGADSVGGFSGPELTDAGQRLQPDFIASYIKNPQKIDPHVWMPTPSLSEQGLQQLTGYLVHLGAKETK